MKIKKLLLISGLILALLGCQNNNNSTIISPNDYAQEIGIKYGDKNVNIIKLSKLKSDDSNESMYRILIHGNFNKNNKHFSYISFSATKYKHHIWAIQFFKNKP